jgi:mannose-6-phosphate isomerase-like protein (cupin superfamily)
MTEDGTQGAAPQMELLDPAKLSQAVRDRYHNRSLTTFNDHEVRLSVMTEPFRWHHHPDSDETFMGIEGGLIIEFDQREIVLRRGQLITIPRSVRHRTRPEGERSVNLTFERQGAETVFDE